VGVISFEQEIGPMVIATATVGMWLIAVSYLGQRQSQLPAQLAGLGTGVGVALALELLLFAVMSGTVDWQIIMSNPLLIIGSMLVLVLAYVGFPIRAFWIGRTLAADRREPAQRSAATRTLAR
jgi:ABC-type thiamin/hydroxymethylpyrimidine transport system permease subunit